ncbi:MAG TPA: hypothetical protein H9690_02000 [Firmicutes bacterium]|nr:hypothetical protein [Bacillota bacterium]
MNLESILKYQAIDIELRKLKREMQSNENYKIAEDARRKFNEMKTVVAKSENTASKVYGGYEESLKYYDEAVRSADELIKKLQDENITDEQAEAAAAKLNEIKARLAEISDFVGNIKKKGESVVHDFSAAQKSGLELKNKYNQARDAMKKLEESYKPKIAALQKQLADARAQMSDADYETYEKASKEAAPPAFVEVYVADGNTMNCSMCGYSLSLNTQSELKERGYCVCEKCHRIIYGKKK